MAGTTRRPLDARERGRLVVALVVLAAFDVLFTVGLAVAVHDRAEAHDSLVHWQARREEESSRQEPPAYTVAFDAPAARIRRLEVELERLGARLLLLAAAVVVTTVLVLLGARAFRKGVPAR